MTRLFSVLAALLLMATPVLAQSAAEYPEDAPNWRSFEDAIAAAQTDGDLVLIHSYAVWCGWCRRLDADTYTDDAVQAYLADHFEVTRLDTESNEAINFFGGDVEMRELAAALGVSSTPTTVFFNSEGQYITKAPSYWPPDQFVLVLRYVREGAYEMMPFPDYVAMIEAEEE